MSETRDPTAGALLDAMEWLAAGSDGWSTRAGAALAAASGIPVPTLNGVWVGGATEPAAVGELLDRVAAHGVPHCLQFPTGLPGLRAVAEGRAMSRDEDIPLMRLDRAPTSPPVPGLRVRRLEPGEVELHAEVAAEGFGAPLEVLRLLVRPPLVEPGDARYYVGEVEGVPVTTGMGLRLGAALGVFDIATPAAHRRRGYGAAITAWIAAEGFESGAGWSWLQSSPDGRSVYRALGYETASDWECWIAA